MTFTRAVSINNWGPAKFVVDGTTVANGTHSTISAALTAASSGDTIFIRPGTYTENLTLKAGVNLVAWEPDGFSANVNIVGNCTHNTAGFIMCSGIRFTTNNAAAITVSGSVASKIRLINCYISAANSTAIIYSSSSVDSSIQIFYCEGNTGTTGVGIYTHTAAGQLSFAYSLFTNTGGSSTASDTTGGVVITYTSFSQPLSSSSAGAYNISYANLNSSSLNVTAFTTAGTGTNFAEYSDFVSGTASAISIGAGTTLNIINSITVNSSNANAITGAGLFQSGLVIVPSGASYGNNVTSQTRVPGSAFELIQIQNASASASLTFSVLNKYNNLKLVWNNVIPASGGGQAMRLRYNQGAGVVTTGYSTSGVFANTSGGPTVPTTVTTFAILGGSLGNGAPACSGSCLIGNPQYLLTTGVTFLTNTANDQGSNGIGAYGGTFGNTAAITALEITMASGNIAQGNFSLYGIPS